jgi:RNA polymerase sigma-70 factor, ECF subfamily
MLNAECQMPKPGSACRFGIRPSAFGLRHSAFGIDKLAPVPSNGSPPLLTDAAPARPSDQVAEAPAAVDAAIVRAAADGDAGAFAALYERYGRMVHGILLARVPRSDVSDLVQDVFLAAWRRLPSLRDPAAFGGWLAMIARNRATDYGRRTPEIVELPESLADERTLEVEAAAGAGLDAEAALDAIRSLPDAYRETLVLRLVEGMSGPEIAARTGLTPASVRVNLHRGMKLLRAALTSASR